MSERAYAALPGHALKRVRLGGLEAIYHAPSGITHLLAEPVPELLDALDAVGAGTFVTAERLVAQIARRFDLLGDDPQERPETVLGERLAELAALGLVRVRAQA
ncbi:MULTISPECIES: HPr-rel-A system PqqD family peptide chaperone [Pseudomonadota]|uniref:HPr-rel-A system PqqD family peptide chaperone n=1 Tax=Pseudomonadota TaxID=1224 RepID=UPI00076AA8B3|nr:MULTISPECIES: HPr-rel-A system PqqD family peptide chaperone [Pseudomonadota]